MLRPELSRKSAPCGVQVTSLSQAKRRSTSWISLPSRGRRNVAADSGVIQRSSIEAEEVAMTSFKTSLVRPAWLALAFVATALPASAQTWINEPDVPRARVYEPRAYYEPRVYESPAYESPDYAPVVSAPPVALTPAQRTTIYRTIIPQGRGRGPIVREQIVTESVAPAPVVRERTAPAASAYAYAVGSRVTDAHALAPMPQAVVATVPAARSYRYMVINNRLLLVDPATGIVVAEVTD
jgi:hypothetical protein